MLRRGARWLPFILLCLWAGASAPSAAAPIGAHEDDDAPGQATPANGGKAYAVRLNRPMKAGQQYRWSADSTLVNTIPPAKGGPAVADTVSVHLDAVVQILNVDKDGEPTEMAATIEECTARTGKEKKVIARPGRVILVEAGKWKSKLTAAVGTLTIDEDALLRSVLSLPRVDDTSDDDLYGTPKPVYVGEAWNVRADQVARSWASAGYRLKPQNISGTVKLKSAETVDGAECVRVTGRTKMEHFLPPALDLPETVQIEDATCEVKFTRLLPSDTSKPVLQESHSMTLHFTLKRDPRAMIPGPREGKLLRSVGVKLQPMNG